jgi:hypothetical protein
MNALAGLFCVALAAAAAGWDPASFADEGTVEFLTVDPPGVLR